MSAAQALLGRFTIGYDVLLEKARRWRISNDDTQKHLAVELLRGLQERYPLALEIGRELVLALFESDRRHDGEVEMRKLQIHLRNSNEELLCRWGRLFKEDGDGLNPYLSDELKNRSPEDKRAQSAEQADRAYADSQKKYDEAYHIRFGHYPGINLATLFLVRAGLACARTDDESRRRFVDEAQKLAGELLKRTDDWPRDQPDDLEVWHPATRAEAHLLLQKWKGCAELYRSIKGTPGQRNSFTKQIQRILKSWELLQVVDRQECHSIDTIFNTEP